MSAENWGPFAWVIQNCGEATSASAGRTATVTSASTVASRARIIAGRGGAHGAPPVVLSARAALFSPCICVPPPEVRLSVGIGVVVIMGLGSSHDHSLERAGGGAEPLLNVAGEPDLVVGGPSHLYTSEGVGPRAAGLGGRDLGELAAAALGPLHQDQRHAGGRPALCVDQFPGELSGLAALHTSGLRAQAQLRVDPGDLEWQDRVVRERQRGVGSAERGR